MEFGEFGVPVCVCVCVSMFPSLTHISYSGA